MKVIDLLNKIANREEVPKKIKYKGIIREYDFGDKDYITRETGEEFYLFYSVLRSGTGDEFVKELNCKVEIIEEDKEIEELDIESIEANYVNNVYNRYDLIEIFGSSINKLRKELNELKKGK